MKESFSIKFIKIFLNIILFFLGCTFLFSIISIIKMPKEALSIKSIISFIVFILYFITIYTLKKILNSLYSNIFSLNNVKNFKIIGYCMLFLSFIDGFIKFKEKSNIQILSTSYGSLKVSCIFYLVLGFMALVLAEIFKKAVHIKNQNDLTI
ncbi:DUF2975 domain-containing protein [Clostridium botulinum]|nr:DUF2975 domain-containing protein [Clostridium botulinum]